MARCSASSRSILSAITKGWAPLAQELNRLRGGHGDQLDPAAIRFLRNVIRDGQRTERAGTHHQAPAIPRNPFLQRQRCMSVLLTQWFGRLLLALADRGSIDDHIVLVRRPVDPDRPEVEALKAHSARVSLVSTPRRSPRCAPPPSAPPMRPPPAARRRRAGSAARAPATSDRLRAAPARVRHPTA